MNPEQIVFVWVFGALRLGAPQLVPLFQLMLAYANVLAL
jgi:hypothetical protein